MSKVLKKTVRGIEMKGSEDIADRFVLSRLKARGEVGGVVAVAGDRVEDRVRFEVQNSDVLEGEVGGDARA